MIGFMDESSPQTAANTVRLWSPDRPESVRNTDRIRANAVGFLPVNGSPAISFPLTSRAGDMCAFLDDVAAANAGREVAVVLDNCPAHRARATLAHAASLGIRLIFLPPYSPHLNPIEFIWKTVKRAVSKACIEDRPHMAAVIEGCFLREAGRPSYFGYWTELFHRELVKVVR